jgi:iron only hydrogenase large subunit-like protein
MACPGGCIGGGGQPLTSTKAIIKKGLLRFTLLMQKKQIGLLTKIQCSRFY